MKVKIQRILAVLVVLGISACSGIPVSQDFEQGFDFSSLKTFTWEPNEENQ